MEIFKIKISPEVLKYDIETITSSGFTFGYYPSLPNILSGGTNGQSLLTDLSIPILLKSDYNDIGYYSVFDGDLSQCIEDVNFIFSGNTLSPYQICIYNTSNNLANYLQETTYFVNWGDGNIEQVTNFIPESVCHLYSNVDTDVTYTISFTGSNNIGNFIIEKDIKIPYTIDPITNPYGTVTFQVNQGSWSTIPTSQNYIFTGDSETSVNSQISSNYVSTPFVVSGFTQSRLNELETYGASPYINDLIIQIEDGGTGYVMSQSPEYTSYTINDLVYFDYSGGTTAFICYSSGITTDMIVSSAMTKFEYLMNIIDQPEIQTNVFIERGKNSGLENFRRIGEVRGMEQLVTYGYKFFNVVNYNEI
jgi:hypothetical protein